MKENKVREELSAYEAAMQGVAFRIIDGAGYIQLAGETRQDYVQRQTSNDVALLSPARAVPNILTSPTGRILEIFTLIEMGETYGLITASKRATPLSQYFQERIFFSDQVDLEDQSERWIQIELSGPEAAGILKALLEIGEAPALNQVAEGRLGEWPLKVIAERGSNPSSPSYLILAPSEAGETLEENLAERGAIRLSNEQVELLRIEAGIPGTMELTPDYTPYELGLGDWVSETKGCYTGQEVLARQVTYDKITRQLVQLSAESPFAQAREVFADDKVVGRITSVTLSPNFGPLALAVVKRPFNELGHTLQARDKQGSINAQVQSPALTATAA